jgi:hypothetical protein
LVAAEPLHFGSHLLAAPEQEVNDFLLIYRNVVEALQPK